MKSFQEILKEKREYYGNTEAAYEFACDEYIKEETTRLNEALKYAIKIIENYQLDIRNYKWVGVNLIEKGFCQGEIYRTALETIGKYKSGLIEKN
jgi:alpha-L-fucosidase